MRPRLGVPRRSGFDAVREFNGLPRMETNPAQDPGKPPRKPWPMIWILIAILAYVAFQTAWIIWAPAR